MNIKVNGMNISIEDAPVVIGTEALDYNAIAKESMELDKLSKDIDKSVEAFKIISNVKAMESFGYKATEGVGQAIAKGAKVVWEKIKLIFKKIIQFIRTVAAYIFKAFATMYGIFYKLGVRVGVCLAFPPVAAMNTIGMYGSKSERLTNAEIKEVVIRAVKELDEEYDDTVDIVYHGIKGGESKSCSTEAEVGVDGTSGKSMINSNLKNPNDEDGRAKQIAILAKKLASTPMFAKVSSENADAVNIIAACNSSVEMNDVAKSFMLFCESSGAAISNMYNKVDAELQKGQQANPDIISQFNSDMQVSVMKSLNAGTSKIPEGFDAVKLVVEQNKNLTTLGNKVDIKHVEAIVNMMANGEFSSTVFKIANSAKSSSGKIQKILNDSTNKMDVLLKIIDSKEPNDKCVTPLNDCVKTTNIVINNISKVQKILVQFGNDANTTFGALRNFWSK